MQDYHLALAADGLLANDLVGFHTRAHALNFLDAVASELEARVDRGRRR